MRTEWLRREIRDYEPYVVAPIAETHVINANENYANAFDIPAVKADILAALSDYKPQIYPKPMADELRAALADYTGLSPENILAGNGGDEMITYALHTFLDAGDQILVHRPTFDMYEIGAKLLGAEAVRVPDLPGYRRDREGILAAIKKYQPKLTFLCNPNNPTGELLPASFIEECVAAAENIVLVDEAYMEFAEAESVLALVSKYPNLIVLRTLSKAFGLAGLRCGYLAAAPALISAIAMVKAPYNLNSLTQRLAVIALRHREEILAVRDSIIAERERFYQEISKIPGLTAYPSRTNFILLQAGDKADELFEAWREADILVKRYKGNKELPGAFRVTITTREVDDEVLRVAGSVMGGAEKISNE